MIALLAGLAMAEEPLHQTWVGADLRAVQPLDELPHHPELPSEGYTPMWVQPSLSYGNLTLWGHAELWMSLTPWQGVQLGDRGEHGFNLPMEVGGRAFFRKFEDGLVTPWIGPSVAPVAFRANGGPTRLSLRMKHAAGISWRKGPWMLTVSVGWVPLVRTRYPLGREQFIDEEDDFFFDSLGPLYTPDPLIVQVGVRRFVGSPEPWRREGLDPYLALGVSGARTLGSLSSFQVDRSFIRGAAPPGVYPEATLGLDLRRVVSLELGYRHIWQRQEAYGLVADWHRDSLALSALLENPYDIGSVYVFVGGGISGEHLRYSDADFDVPVQVASFTTLRPVGTLGIRYKPNDLDWLRVRTHVRVTPLLYATQGSLRASFQHVEVSLLQLEVHPRRF